jgi:hypothetical protein
MYRGIAVALLGSAFVAAGCQSTISQDAKSGNDARAKGAKTIQIGDDGEGSAKDVVTYPGGDRVDWKSFDIKAPKDITVSVKWKPPRDGLDLAFNVMDSGYNVLTRARPSPGTGKTKKEVDVKGANAGRYYVQIYAPERGDAAEYTVEVSVRDPAKVDTGNMPPVPDPPRLAMLPAPPCPPGTPPDKCAGPPPPPCPPGAPANTMCACMPGNTPPPCPPPPPICPAGAPQGTPCVCDKEGTVPPPCPVAPVTVYAAITERSISGQGLNITLNRGTGAKVQKGCPGVVLRGAKGEKEVSNSTFTITDVTERESRGTIPKMTLDELGTNTRAKLVCPQK